MTTSIRSMKTRDYSERGLDVSACDGFRLKATVFTPAEPPRGTVLIHGATAVPAAFYRRFAGFLASSGLRTVTYDYRGIGASAPRSLRGFEATMSDWAELDARGLFHFVRSEWPEPVALVGHSFGGQLIGLVDELRHASGALLVASQLGYYGYWPLLERPRLWAIWRGVVPAATLAYGYLPGKLGLGKDLPSGVAREWARWCSQPGYLLSEHPSARGRFAAFEGPVRAYSFGDDDYAPERAVEELVALFVNTRVDHRRFAAADLGMDEVGHFGFFRPQLAETLWPEALEFLDATCSGKKPAAPEIERRRLDELWGFDASDIMADLNYGRA